MVQWEGGGGGLGKEGCEKEREAEGRSDIGGAAGEGVASKVVENGKKR